MKIAQAPHTPTPWIAKPHKGDIKLMATIGGADGIQIAYTTPENAAFIVRACNSYEELLNSLKVAYRLLLNFNEAGQLSKFDEKKVDELYQAIAKVEAV